MIRAMSGSNDSAALRAAGNRFPSILQCQALSAFFAAPLGICRRTPTDREPGVVAYA
jgi:hypothetical protein